MSDLVLHGLYSIFSKLKEWHYVINRLTIVPSTNNLYYSQINHLYGMHMMFLPIR
jgi:hypothetical protein